MSPLPHDFLAAEKLLSSNFVFEIDLYAACHEAAKRLLPTDAFYVCRVQRRPDWLHFVYNCEGDHFDKPEPFPFGNGPTSRVALSGKPVIMSTFEDRHVFELVRFADSSTTSGAAIHWPLWIEAAASELPDGVLSVQAYQSGVYGDEHLATVEWLSLRMAQEMRRQRDREIYQAEIKSAEASVNRNRAVEDVRRFVTLLDELLAFRENPARLLSEVRRRQVELTQWAPTAPVASDAMYESLASLSPRELEVLVHVAQGFRNEEVAEILMCSKHTIKRHLDNVYGQTPLRNRAEIAGAKETIQAAWMARKGHA